MSLVFTALFVGLDSMAYSSATAALDNAIVYKVLDKVVSLRFDALASVEIVCCWAL